MQPRYNPSVFHVNDIPQAMRIILTAEDSTTEERWRIETPHVVDLITQNHQINATSVVLDFGCGIGRIAHELIGRTGCRVVGIDISPSMRALSVIYARSDRFMSCSAEMLDAMIERGFRFDLALSVWVLQHCLDPRMEIARMRRALTPTGGMFVVNMKQRCVPTVEAGWLDDGVDLKEVLSQEFNLRNQGTLASDKTTNSIINMSYWASFAQRAS